MVVVEGENVLHHVKREGKCPGKCPGGEYVQGDVRIPHADVYVYMLAGANPNRRDSGRSLCAEEWARFCGCHNCADAIAKYIRSKKYFFKKTFLQLSKEKWTSEPDLLAGKSSAEKSRGSGGGGGSSWLQRHLSLKRKKSTRPGEFL